MCAFVVNVPLEIEASRGSAIKGIRADRTIRADHLAPASFASFCLLFPPFLGEFRSHRASQTYLGFLGIAPPPPRGRGAVVAECPFIFIFVAFPRGAVSPYIYLIAPPDPQSRSTIPLCRRRPFAALAYSRPRVLCASIIRAVSHPALACPRNN